MTDDSFDAEQYVRQAAALLGIPLDQVRVEGVAQHFLIAAGLAEQIMDVSFGPEDEPAPRFEP